MHPFEQWFWKKNFGKKGIFAAIQDLDDTWRSTMDFLHKAEKYLNKMLKQGVIGNLNLSQAILLFEMSGALVQYAQSVLDDPDAPLEVKIQAKVVLALANSVRTKLGERTDSDYISSSAKERLEEWRDRADDGRPPPFISTTLEELANA